MTRCVFGHDWDRYPAGEWREQECARCGAGRYLFLRQWVDHRPRATWAELALESLLVAGIAALPALIVVNLF